MFPLSLLTVSTDVGVESKPAVPCAVAGTTCIILPRLERIGGDMLQGDQNLDILGRGITLNTPGHGCTQFPGEEAILRGHLAIPAPAELGRAITPGPWQE